MSDRMNKSLKSIEADIEQLEELATSRERHLTQARVLYCSIVIAGIKIIAKSLMVIAVEMRQHRP